MANRLRMADIEAITALAARGWSRRRIARELGVDRATVVRHLAVRNTAIPPTGTGEELSPNTAIVPAGSQPGRQSVCEPLREVILQAVDRGLTAQRIYQDLVSEQGFEGHYDSVKRFCRKLRQMLPLPFRRMECDPGEEAQVDFGQGAWVVGPEGKKRRPHLFRIVLSHSRKAYSEVVWRQTTEAFIQCLENAFIYFGGTTKTTVIDNLKAAVLQADWYDPEIHPKLQDFQRHYGTVILPTKSYTPRHKGKIERGVGYAQGNALKGRSFDTLAAQNVFLLHWEETIADHRIHGTTRRQVLKAFEEEKPHLGPLPGERFPFFQEAQRMVHRDQHVAVEHSYYAVPAEYLGRELWVRWDSRVVRVFNQRMEQVIVHARVAPGRFSTPQELIPQEKISGVERGAAYLLRRAALVGPDSGRWSQAMLKSRGIEGIRVLQGFLSLAGKHGPRKTEEAARLALGHGAFRLKALRRLIDQPTEQEQLPFLEEHPLIRTMSEYGALVAACVKNDPPANPLLGKETP